MKAKKKKNLMFSLLAAQARDNLHSHCLDYDIAENFGSATTFEHPSKNAGYGAVLLVLSKAKKLLRHEEIQARCKKHVTSNRTSMRAYIYAGLVERVRPGLFKISDFGRSYLKAWLGC